VPITRIESNERREMTTRRVSTDHDMPRIATIVANVGERPRRCRADICGHSGSVGGRPEAVRRHDDDDALRRDRAGDECIIATVAIGPSAAVHENKDRKPGSHVRREHVERVFIEPVAEVGKVGMRRHASQRIDRRRRRFCEQ